MESTSLISLDDLPARMEDVKGTHETLRYSVPTANYHDCLKWSPRKANKGYYMFKVFRSHTMVLRMTEQLTNLHPATFPGLS